VHTDVALQAGEGVQATARPSFLKKRSKKLLQLAFHVSFIRETARLHLKEQKFFGSFFQKRTAFFLRRRPCQAT
jgi:hypothetical protein